MRLTCSTRSFPIDDLALSLARVRWAGFGAVEIALPDDPDGRPEDAAVKTLLEKSDLELSAIDAGTLDFTGPEQALESVAYLGRCAVLARQLDGPRVLFRADGTLAHTAYGISKLFAVMPGHAFELCAVNAPESALTVPEDFEELANRSSSDRLGLALDPAAAHGAGWDPEEFARAAEIPLRYLYFDDTQNSRPALPGCGELDWERLLTELHADGYDGYLSLLLPGTDPLRAESDAKEARGLAEALSHSVE
jgi:sugar phosphate isomerase/epimerase